jgi:serine/threonine protein kinase
MGTPAPGTQLGAYRIDGVIGAGSMGDVFRATDVGLSRKVAIKILSEKHKDSNELRARFTREGRAVAAIAHPNVVQVFATGTCTRIARTSRWSSSRAPTSRPWSTTTGRCRRWSAARALLDAARGLDGAARAGLIHRDVKPSNMVRLTDGRVKVTDFGLAKPVDPGSEPALTALGVVVGTPDYIAPEQARGEKIDERVDHLRAGRDAVLPLDRGAAVPHRQPGRGQVPEGGGAPPEEPAARRPRAGVRPSTASWPSWPAR